MDCRVAIPALAPADTFVDRALANGVARVVEQFDQRRRRFLFPIDSQASRIDHRRHPAATDAVDPAEHVRLGELGRRAASIEPAARVDDQQTAVGVFQHIGRMKLTTGR